MMTTRRVLAISPQRYPLIPTSGDHKYDKGDSEQEGDGIVKQRGFGLPKAV